MLFVGCCFSLGSKVGRFRWIHSSGLFPDFQCSPQCRSGEVGEKGNREGEKGGEVGVEIFYVSGAKVLDDGGKGKLLR